jgi:hypothetical protein
MRHVKLTFLILLVLHIFSLNSLCAQETDASISIDLGRQLFVDDYLIEKTDLEKITHRAEKKGQVMKPETELEMGRGVSNPGTLL